MIRLFCLILFCSNQFFCADDISSEEGVSKDGKTNYYNFLYKKMREDATEKIAKKEKEVVIPTGYGVPGPQEPLPGRSHNGNYFPLFPFHSAYVGGVELDPSISRHIGGDINIPVPSWGMIDFNGDFNNRIRNTVLKTGVSADPVNNLGLRQKDFNRMMGSPSFLHNRQNQPTIPLVKLPREFVPKSCKAPLCNPYQQSVGYGLEYDWGGNDGVNGGFDFNMPVSKEVGFRVPVSGNIYYALENITITYAQNLGALDPKTYLLKDDMENDPFNFPDIYVGGIPRQKRTIKSYQKVLFSPTEYKYNFKLTKQSNIFDSVDIRKFILETLKTQLYQVVVTKNFVNPIKVVSHIKDKLGRVKRNLSNYDKIDYNKYFVVN